MNHTEIFNKLWQDYSQINPNVNKIYALLENRGEYIVNDHVAFRTFNLPGINIDELSKPFIKAGYIKKGNYFFESKRLNASHFEHKTDASSPKVFISELITEDFSDKVQKTAEWITSKIKKSGIGSDDLIFSKRIWNPISYNDYESLRRESEYAAWLYVYGFRANHFTIFVNKLKSIPNLESLNTLLKQEGYRLNNSGGEIKGSEEEKLKQSSTLADNISVQFFDGTFEIPCCYYEFAERFTDEHNRLFSGFIAKSADKIFESTDKQ